MRIAVTGGLGFVGQKIVERLLEDPRHAVTIVDFWKSIIPKYERSRFPILGPTYRNITRAASMLEPRDLLIHDVVKKFDLIVHAGAVVDTTDMGDTSEGLWDLNVDFTQQLCWKLNSTAGTGIIFISSAATYGADGFPNNPYGLSKVLGEKAVHASHTNDRFSSILRLFNVFGELEHHKGAMASVPFKMAQAYRAGERFELFAPDASRDFVPVDSVATAVMNEIAAAGSVAVRVGPEEVRINDVGTGVSTSFRDVDYYVRIATRSTATSKIIEMPKELVGRYQGYTRAGAGKQSVITSPLTTKEAIDVYYSPR